MKKLLLIIAMAITVPCFSQAITVSTNTHTVPQLVNSVLINSPCVSATNITWKTGTNFSSSNGIGFFQNSNANFPMQSGVMLSTGDVMHGVGPNTSDLNDGAANWPGDTDLENTLLQSGITMSSVNASVLEFDFTPISPTFSFEFLFASEEYGNFQCQFSDAFAFLLTNTATGVTTNLAVVPSTNIPISVVTIRDFLYNSSCPSANSQFFGSYNGGSAAGTAAINFNGQTKLMNAAAVLTPNTTYHIKLVIADRSDSGSDSAIFIASDTFNIGQDVLGLDMTTANNTALCFGTNYTLTSNLNPADYTFSWTKNGTTIAGENGPNLDISLPGFYSITYQKTTSGCQPITDYITVEYLPEIIAQNPNNLYRCDTGATTYTYNLDLNTSVVKTGLNPLTQVNYYASSADANAGINAIPASYTAALGTTIYVRIKNYNNACYIVKSFQLLTSAPPVAHQAPNITKCSGSTFNNAAFDLNQQNAVILGSQSVQEYKVTYYTSQANATSGTNPISNNFTFATNNTTIYVRVESLFDSSCFTASSSFTLLVNSLPPVDIIESAYVCVGYTLPPLTNGNYFMQPNGGGTALFAGEVITSTSTIYIFNQPNGPTGCSNSSNFVVTILDPDALVPESDSFCGGYTLPAPAVGGFFTGHSGTGTEILPGTLITSTQTINFYYEATEAPFCIIDQDFTITILPTITLGTFSNIFDCTSYTLPALAQGNYYTQPNAGGTLLTAGTVLTTTQSVFVYATTPDHCTAESSFGVFIGVYTPADVSQCEPYTLPVLPIGKYYTGPAGSGQEIPAGTVINLSQTLYVYVANSGSNCTDDIHFSIAIAQPIIDTLPNMIVCDSYTLPVLASGEYYTAPNAGGTRLYAGHVLVASQIIYIFKQSASSAGCNNQSSFVVAINPKPVIDSRSDIDICNSYVLTNLAVGNYYTGPNGTGTMLPGGTVITTSQRIYIHAVAATAPFCTNENSFYISVFSVQADAPADVTACDRYVLPALTSGNYFKLPTGPHSGEGNMMLAGDVLTTSQTVYVYIESGGRINCVDEHAFNVTINTSPVVSPIAHVYAANAYTLPALTLGNYFTQPNGGGTPLFAGDSIVTDQTIYVFAETGTIPNCTDEESFEATIYNVDELADVTICEGYTLPVLAIGGYYTGPLGTGTHLFAGQTISSSQTIYVYGIAPFDGVSYDESSFDVTIVDTPSVNSIPTNMLKVCDMDGTNDGSTNFDLTTLNTTVLGTQTGPQFTATYYTTFNDAVAGTNAVTVTDVKTIFVKVSNTLTTNCFDIKSIQIRVNKLPEPTPQSGTMCYDTRNNTLINPYTISSGLSSSAYLFQWYNEDGDVVGTGSTYQAILPGVYSVVATDIVTGCISEPTPATVVSSEPAIVSYAVTEAFDDNQVITVEATGTGGDYEYQLDHGLFQNSPTFDNVPSGIHTITVRDKNGCGITTSQALIVNYPKFFTPNGDGYNDTWNIKELKDQAKSVIYIYDRYGKIMTQIKPDGRGWDGTVSGQTMPSDDYWFTISYVEDNVEKEFKSHFSIKR